MEYERTLNEEIQSELEALRVNQAIGDTTYKTTVEGLTKLVDRSIELKKLEVDELQKTAELEVSSELKLQQMENDKKDKQIGYVINVGTTILTVVVTIWGTMVCLKFEETGTVRSLPGRSFLNKLLKK